MLLLNILVMIIVAFNIYCIMLQRYNKIRMQLCIEKRMILLNKRAEKKELMLRELFKNRDKRELRTELHLVQRMMEQFQNESDCFLTDSDAPTLERMAAYFCDNMTHSFQPEKVETTTNDLMQTHLTLPDNAYIFDKTEARVLKLQRIISSIRKERLYGGFSVITETDRCEKAYNKLFPVRSYDAIIYTLNIYFSAYEASLLI